MPKSFTKDVRPFFRPQDIGCMNRGGVLLDSQDYMCDLAGSEAFADHANARTVYARLTAVEGRMPPDGKWPKAKLDVYAAWMADGFLP